MTTTTPTATEPMPPQSTSPITYDFEQAKKPGRTGWVTRYARTHTSRSSSTAARRSARSSLRT